MRDQSILQSIDKLESTIAHDESILEIKNLIAKYAMYFHAGDPTGILSCFAEERDDIEVVFGRGKIFGMEAVKEFYSNRPQIVRLPGTFVTHEINTDVITIANDGKTARITANVSGIKGLAPAGSQVNLLGRYYFDAVRESSGWKIWHLQWALTADADFNYGWLFQNRAYYIEDEYPALSEEPRPNMKLEKADAYLDYFKPDEVQVMLPEPPQAYDTWDGYEATKNTRGY